MTTSTTGAPIATVRRQRADARRNSERVLDAARAVFAEHGPEASLEEVARRAEVGIGTLYRHYPTRQALLAAVFHDDVESARARAEELLQSDAPLDAFTTWLHDQLEQAGACRGLAASVMITMLDEQPDFPSPCEAMREGGAALLARAQESGDVRADASIDDLLRLVSAIAIATEDAPNGHAQSERMFALLMDGVRSERETMR
jgi:AcrR family transcriptional regulator